MKNIFIFTDDNDFESADRDYVEDFINENFGNYTVIISEDNQNILTNEEGDSYMVMEYLD